MKLRHWLLEAAADGDGDVADCDNPGMGQRWSLVRQEEVVSGDGDDGGSGGGRRVVGWCCCHWRRWRSR